MISKEKKQQIIKELLEQIKKAKAIYFVNFLGLKVSEINELRQRLKQNNSVAKVVKKNLAGLALSQAGYENRIADDNVDSLMINFAFEDPISTAKALWSFSKKNNKFRVLGGILDGAFLASEEVIKLAKIPSKEILLGRLVGSVASPIQRLLYTLNGNIQKLVVVLEGIKAIRQLAETI
jgi:large subunit ribosomal protein L10